MKRKIGLAILLSIVLVISVISPRVVDRSVRGDVARAADTSIIEIVGYKISDTYRQYPIEDTIYVEKGTKGSIVFKATLTIKNDLPSDARVLPYANIRQRMSSGIEIGGVTQGTEVYVSNLKNNEYDWTYMYDEDITSAIIWFYIKSDSPYTRIESNRINVSFVDKDAMPTATPRSTVTPTFTAKPTASASTKPTVSASTKPTATSKASSTVTPKATATPKSTATVAPTATPRTTVAPTSKPTVTTAPTTTPATGLVLSNTSVNINGKGSEKIKISSIPEKDDIKNITTTDGAVATGRLDNSSNIIVESQRKAGKATLTVTTENGLSQNIAVTVKGVLKLNKTSITLNRGEKFKIKLDAYPTNIKIKRCSSNKSKIASVTKIGKVTAKKKGKAIIRVVTTNNVRLNLVVIVK